MKTNYLYCGIAVAFLLCGPIPAFADQIELIVTGAQGDGLLPGNIDPPTSSTGSGAIGLGGIVYDTDTNLLNLDIEWGSGNGHSDLTGDVTLLHLHGPTADMAPNNFGQVNSQILVNLGNSLKFMPSGSAGGLSDTFFLSNQQEMYLLSGRTYINVHTNMYPMGEIRGYLVAATVPEPTSAALVFGLLLIALQRRERSAL